MLGKRMIFQRHRRVFMFLVFLATTTIFLIQVSEKETFLLDAPTTMIFEVPLTHRPMRPRSLQDVDDWSDVPGAAGRWMVYSAHLSITPDSRERITLVTALDQTLKIKRAFCHVWNSSDSYTTRRGEMTQLPEDVHRFTTAVVWCPVNHVELGPFLRVTVSPDEQTGISISDALEVNGFHEVCSPVEASLQTKLTDASLVPHRETAGKNRSKLEQFERREIDGNEKPRKKNKTEDLAVCVRPIYGGYNNAFRIIEFVELFKILGANFFFFYNHSVGPDVDRILQLYVEEGEAEVLPWSLPIDITKTIHAYGQLPAQNDCHLRASRFTFVAMLDLDEMFVPRKEDNLITMLKGIGQYSSYVLRNAFFYDFREDDATFKMPDFTPEKRENLSSMRGPAPTSRPELCLLQPDAAFLTLRKTQRVAVPSPTHVRPKYVVRPRHVAVVDVHKVFQFHKGIFRSKQTYTVPEATALSHHYRACELRTEQQCRKAKTRVDRTTHKFSAKLISAVQRTLYRCV